MGVTREAAEVMLQQHRQVAAEEFAKPNPTLPGRIVFLEEFIKRLGGDPSPKAPAPQSAALGASTPSSAPVIRPAKIELIS